MGDRIREIFALSLLGNILQSNYAIVARLPWGVEPITAWLVFYNDSNPLLQFLECYICVSEN